MASAVKAPRGSPFLDEVNRLTPAWHNYIASVERLTNGIVDKDIGAQLSIIAQRIAALETQLDEVEAVYKKRNWAFSYGEHLPTINAGQVLFDHGLNTTYLIGRSLNNDFSGGNGSTHSAELLNENTVIITTAFATYGGGGNARAWVLGFYDDYQK